MKNTIIVEKVNKIFEIPHEKVNTFKGYFLNPFRKIRKDKFMALQDVSFEIEKGDFIGIIGRNGSGKSTLLKMLAEIYEPTSGKIIINGSIVSFLELGVGFNPELSGRENIFLNGTILGMTKSYIEDKFNEIVDFSEIREFIDLPVKNYSSGMVLRLAFSVAMQARADIYLLDEIMAVGDAAFAAKSLAKILELLHSGATVVLVSHNLPDIEKYCKRVLLMHHGKLIFDGDSKTAIAKYKELL